MTETLIGTPARNYVGGEWREAGSGETYQKRDPWRPSEVTGVFQASRRRRRPRGRRGRGVGVPGVGRAPGACPRGDLPPSRRRDRRADGADRTGHDCRDGEAAPRGTHGDRARGDDPPLRGRRGVASGRRGLRGLRPAPAPVHGASPARRRRPDHAVELPDRDPRVEARAGADPRQHRRAQARPRRAADGTPRRRVLRRGGPARRRPQRAHRLRLGGRLGARREPRRARDLLHGLGRGRAGRPRRRRPRAAAASSWSWAARTRSS